MHRKTSKHECPVTAVPLEIPVGTKNRRRLGCIHNSCTWPPEERYHRRFYSSSVAFPFFCKHSLIPEAGFLSACLLRVPTAEGLRDSEIREIFLHFYPTQIDVFLRVIRLSRSVPLRKTPTHSIYYSIGGSVVVGVGVTQYHVLSEAGLGVSPSLSPQDKERKTVSLAHSFFSAWGALAVAEPDDLGS